jgi:hypothetical protein
VSEVFVHEDYLPENPQDPKGPYNDVAVIKVSKYIFRMNNASEFCGSQELGTEIRRHEPLAILSHSLKLCHPVRFIHRNDWIRPIETSRLEI